MGGNFAKYSKYVGKKTVVELLHSAPHTYFNNKFKKSFLTAVAR